MQYSFLFKNLIVGTLHNIGDTVPRVSPHPCVCLKYCYITVIAQNNLKQSNILMCFYPRFSQSKNLGEIFKWVSVSNS